MRDILVTIIFFGALPYVFKKPQIGIYLWSWIGYMNPHRLGWGFAYNFPFAYISAIAIIISFFSARREITFFWSPLFTWLVALNAVFLVSTYFSLQPDASWEQWIKVVKIQAVCLISVWIINSKEKIHIFIWIIALSIGFFGIKGGIFTITSGGSGHVLGPSGSYISGNTEIGLGLVMILPLCWYLYISSTKKWIRFGLIIAILLIAIAIIGTQSRGAFLAIISIAFFLWLKSRKKLIPFFIIILLTPLVIMFMPQSWHDRMSTIKTYEEDGSAMGRIKAWTFAIELANARPLTGGGFESFHENNYEFFTPGLIQPKLEGYKHYPDVHSIYFEVLGEHGYLGLLIFLIIGYLCWRNGNKVIVLTKNSHDYKWAHDLASMIQVSFIGYAVGGAFLGLAYFDLPYHFAIILVQLLRIVQQPVVLDKKLDSISTSQI